MNSNTSSVHAARRVALAPTTAALILGGVLLTHPARAATPVGLWYAEGGAARSGSRPDGGTVDAPT
jgi:hypothetical protein